MSAIPVPTSSFRANSMGYRQSPDTEDSRCVACQRRFPAPGENRADEKGNLLSPRGDNGNGSRARLAGFSLFGFEHLRLELVALEQLVELGAIALRELRRLGHAAAGDAQDANQVFALEGSPRLLERGELRGLLLQRLLDERGGHDARSAESNRLFDHVDELPHVARPRCCKEHLKRLRSHCLDVLSVTRSGDSEVM